MPGSDRTPVTMQDVARHARVSPQTVSNVVNGRSARVGDETRDRVIESITALGYRVNQSARSLRRGRTGMVGLGIPTFDSHYYGALAETLNDRFVERGLRLVTENTGGAVRAEIESLASSRLDSYDGFVLALAAGDTAHFDRIGTDKPIVLLGERALSSRFDHVLMDNVGGARLATQLLLRTGARSIVALGGVHAYEETMPGLRTRGYVEAHAAIGMDVDPALIVPSAFGTKGGYGGTRALIESGQTFDAVFAFTDAVAFGALRALADARLRVPEDVQVVGFDNTAASRYTVPRLTTVEPANAARAASVVDLLVSRIRHRDGELDRRVVVHPASIVERETTRRIAAS